MVGNRLRVRVAVEGDAGAGVAGRLRVTRGKAVLGSARFKGTAGQLVTVNVGLTRAARKALAGGRRVSASLVASGADSGGAAIAARQKVTLAR